MYLWLNVLILVPDWNKDQNVLHLMDTIIRAVFFHLDTRSIMDSMFQSLYSVRKLLSILHIVIIPRFQYCVRFLGNL